jgi:tetratricopeptide (TPR) repeat protein
MESRSSLDTSTRYSEDSEAYSGRAEALWYTGRLQDAIRDYSRALELKPNNIMSLSGRGQVLGEAGEHGRAIEDLDLAVRALEKRFLRQMQVGLSGTNRSRLSYTMEERSRSLALVKMELQWTNLRCASS